MSLNIKILLQDTVESLSYSIKQLLLKEVVWRRLTAHIYKFWSSNIQNGFLLLLKITRVFIWPSYIKATWSIVGSCHIHNFDIQWVNHIWKQTFSLTRRPSSFSLGVLQNSKNTLSLIKTDTSHIVKILLKLIVISESSTVIISQTVFLMSLLQLYCRLQLWSQGLLKCWVTDVIFHILTLSTCYNLLLLLSKEIIWQDELAVGERLCDVF